jgi:hypothetical protein
LTFIPLAAISRLSDPPPYTLTIAVKRIRVVDQEDSIGEIGSKLAKLGREATKRKEDVPGLFSPGGIG